MLISVRSSVLFVMLGLLICACAGVPVTTMDYFAKLGPRLMDADP